METEKVLNKKKTNIAKDKKTAKSNGGKKDQATAKLKSNKVKSETESLLVPENTTLGSDSAEKDNKAIDLDKTLDIAEPKDLDVPILDTPTISPDFELEEESKTGFFEKFKMFWKKLFSKKPKTETTITKVDTETQISDKKTIREEKNKSGFANFWMIVAIILISAIITLLVTIITQSVLENKNTQKEIQRQATIYNIGDKEVPSFKYYTNSSDPILIIDQKTASTQEVKYRFSYTSLNELNNAKAEYITALKNYGFTIFVENIDDEDEEDKTGGEEFVRFYEGTLIKVAFETKTAGDKFTLTIKYNRHL